MWLRSYKMQRINVVQILISAKETYEQMFYDKN